MAPVSTILFAALLAGASASRLAPKKEASPGFSKMKLTPKTAAKFDKLEKLNMHASWNNQPKAPEHITTSATSKVRQHFQSLDLGMIPFVKKGGCHKKLSSKKLGWQTKKAAKLLAKSSKVSKAAEHPGRESFSVPGAGTTQKLADNGLSETGTVGGEEPFVTVLKDGYFEVGCFTDAMNEFGDKFGDEKDKYGAIAGDTSIVRYSEIVLKEKQVAMTPTVCFEFCRSIEDMVFFGISNGRDCYCTPYYKPAQGDDKKCDSTCEGDETLMCGNQKKSTIWEMHLCADTAKDLEDAMTAAKEALDFFFEQAVLSTDLAKKTTAAGASLEKTAGLAGSPVGADMGMKAKQSTKDLGQTYKVGDKMYDELLAAYEIGDGLKGEDFTDATKTTEAEHATAKMKELTGPVLGEAQSMYALVKLTYPGAASLLGDEPEKGDGAAEALAGDMPFDYRVASYAMDPLFPAGLSACKGPIIGNPVFGLDVTDCGKACSGTVYPDKCVGFSHYSTDDGDLCFMLSDVSELMTFECPDAPKACIPKSNEAAEHCTPSAACYIKMSEISTGYKPKADWQKTSRCFAEPATKGLTAYEMPSLGGTASLLGKDELKAAP
jgi:hypothetical protein